MKIIRNNVIPFKGFNGINLFGVLFVRKNVVVSERMLNHERIHTAQMRELLYAGFYLWYFIEWLIRLCKDPKTAYRNICFEAEAYSNQYDMEYLKQRKSFSFWKYK